MQSRRWRLQANKNKNHSFTQSRMWDCDERKASTPAKDKPKISLCLSVKGPMEGLSYADRVRICNIADEAAKQIDDLIKEIEKAMQDKKVAEAHLQKLEEQAKRQKSLTRMYYSLGIGFCAGLFAVVLHCYDQCLI